MEKDSMSIQDILDELNEDELFEDADDGIDEILAEFSDDQKQKTPSGFDFLEKYKQRATEAAIETVLQKEFSEPENVSEKEKNEEKTAHVIDTIAGPWEDGTFGESPLDEKKKERRKVHRVSKFAETFDTFTRSELFEENSNNEELKVRTVEEIIAENGKVSKLLGLRVACLGVLVLLSCYYAFAEPLNLFLPDVIAYFSHPFRYLFITAALQILSMLLSVDVLSKGLSRLCRLKPTVESAIMFSSFATLIHVLTVMAAPQWRGWLPYSCISIATLFFAIYGKWIHSKALCRVCRIVKSAKYPELVHIETVFDETNIIKKTSEDTHSFISHINDNDASNVFWKYLSSIVIISSVVFALIASFGTKTPQHFFWALAGISCVSTPFFAMLSFSFPFSIIAKSLASIGAAISGWFSASNLTKKANFVVSDHDIFPKGTVTLHGLKILGEYSLEQTVCYAASVIEETKSGLSDVFSDLLKSRYGVATTVKNLKYHESGGIEAEIGNDSVLVGTAGFMLRSGVRLTSGTNTRNAVFVAINGSPAGVFNINYKANIEVERALHMLVKKHVPVVLAVRDFNLLPMMVEQEFGLRDGVLEYPEIEQRIDLSSDEQFIGSDAVAIVTRSGMQPISAVVLASKKLRRATIRNICLTTASSAIGMLLMFCLTFMQKPVLVTPHTVFAYMLLWFVSTLLMSIRVKR